MTEDGGTAFPEVFTTRDGDVASSSGMSLRDYFAAHAPDVPGWFIHQEPPKDFKPAPTADDVNEAHREEVEQWLKDGRWDLPDELQWFQRKHARYREKLEDWFRLNQAERFYQWRWHYAAKMLQVRDRP